MSTKPVTQIPPPSVEQLRQLFTYDEERGRLVWRQSWSNRIKIGQDAGCSRPDGYRVVHCNGHLYREHRLIWMYHYGSWPSMIDHVNGIRSDNRIANLRPATRSQNMRNTGAHMDNATGLKGVVRIGRKFSARILLEGKQKQLGVYATPHEAHAAYARALSKHFPEFGRAE